MNRLFTNLKGQLLYRGYHLRFAIIYFLVMDLILLLLPVSVCQYLDQKLIFLVMLVNFTYAFSIIVLFFSGIAYVDGQGRVSRQESILCSEANPWLRLLARLLTNLVFSGLCFGNAILGSRLMEKFADENHSYFVLKMNGNLLFGFFGFALVFPLLFHLVNLFIHKENVKSMSLPILVLLFFFIRVYNVAFSRFPDWLTALVMVAIMAGAFWQAGRLEQKWGD